MAQARWLARGVRTSQRRVLGVGLVVAGAAHAAERPGNLTGSGASVAAARVGAPADARTDRLELWARGETHTELFQRSLLPGPNGALPSTDTLAKVRQYVRLGGQDIDTPWRKDSLDVELSAWADATFGPPGLDRPTDGDIQSANVSYRDGPWAVRLGRQLVAGGAARTSRFDGLSATAELGAGFDVQGYGGLTVLPRWNQQPGYHYLGAAVDSDLRQPGALPSVDRRDYWLGGGRVGYRSRIASGGISFRDQWEHGGLSHLDLGADARADLSVATASATAVMDLDSRRFADARLWVDASPTPTLDVSAEYLHAEPALLLSRQSVLAVFSTDGYDEAGGHAVVRIIRPLSVEGGAFVQLYESGTPGGRAEGAFKARIGRAGATTGRVGYTRVQAPANGYHSVRASLVQRFDSRVSGTLEAYGYVYDHALRGVTTSRVYAGTLSVRPADALSVLAGVSLAQSPYALLDAQALVRLAVDFDLGPRRDL